MNGSGRFVGGVGDVGDVGGVGCVGGVGGTRAAVKFSHRNKTTALPDVPVVCDSVGQGRSSFHVLVSVAHLLFRIPSSCVFMLLFKRLVICQFIDIGIRPGANTTKQLLVEISVFYK